MFLYMWIKSFVHNHKAKTNQNTTITHELKCIQVGQRYPLLFTSPDATTNLRTCICQVPVLKSLHFLYTELLIRQNKGLLSSSTILLAVDDPRHNIGSGSATLNALLCVTEYLAAQNNETVSVVLIICATLEISQVTVCSCT